MATTGISPQKKNLRGPIAVLSGAICEWFLIFLLFVDATFSYILRRFAEYCELQAPCVLCSRIDTPSGKRRFEYYNSLLCRSHREEISSLVSCHVHGKLTDVREMCEECFMPMHEWHDKLKSDSYMVGKLGAGVEKHSVQRLILHKKILPTSSGPRICPCCNRSWGAKPSAQRFLKLTPVGFGASKANVKPPLPRVSGRSRFSRRNNFMKLSGRALAIPQSEVKSPRDVLSHVGYTELKITSDSESEVNLSDEEEGVTTVRGRNDRNQEHDTHQGTHLKLQTDDGMLEKQSNQDFANASSLFDQHMQPKNLKTLSTHGLEELNWEKPYPRTNIPVSPELNLVDYVIKTHSNKSGDATITVKPQPHIPSIVTPAELIPLKNTPPCSDDKIEETLKSHDEDDMTQARQPVTPTGLSDGGVPHILNNVSLTNSSAMTDEGKEVSTTSVEQPSSSGSTKSEDIKSVIHQSAPEKDDSQNIGEASSDWNHVQGIASLERNDSSLKFAERVTLSSGSTKFEDIKSVIQQSAPEQGETQNVDDPLSSDGNHVQALPSLERNDSRLKFAERANLSDIEGETSIDMLKSQIEYDKQCLNDLYKELEEERNASAIAANEAMAMITRLQEEKAALHMEALQYLRMMDEQAEYDMEALQKANDELAEKEKELQDLEYELELYRDNTHAGSPAGPHKESISTMVKNTTEDSCVRHNESNMCEPSSPVSSKMGIADSVSGNAKSSMSNLDEEKLYLVEYLKQLERRIRDVSCTKPRADLNNSGHLELSSNKLYYQENPLAHDQVDSAKEADGLHMRNGFSEVDGTSSKASYTHLLANHNACCEETNHNRCNWHNLSTSGRETNMETLENETKIFKERLKAFEADLEFIKHSLRALHNANDGLEYIQQIIDQLQELRNIEFKKRCLSIP